MKKENRLKRIFSKKYNKISNSDIDFLNDVRMEIESKKIFDKPISKEENKILIKIQDIFSNTIDLLEKDDNVDHFLESSKLFNELMDAILEGRKEDSNKIMKRINKRKQNVKEAN
jgi:hypothetical protein